MPRISDQRRAERREQVLEAARDCLQEHGLEAVSMEMIIARSGLSTGAVYGYFKGKDQILNAAIAEGTARLGDTLLPILTDPAPPPLPELVESVLSAIVAFGTADSGVDRLRVAVHGWSHSQSSDEMQQIARDNVNRLREAYAQAARRLQIRGDLGPVAEPDAVAQLLTSVTLGFVVQHALSGKADVRAHAGAVAALALDREPDPDADQHQP